MKMEEHTSSGRSCEVGLKLIGVGMTGVGGGVCDYDDGDDDDDVDDGGDDDDGDGDQTSKFWQHRCLQRRTSAILLVSNTLFRKC